MIKYKADKTNLTDSLSRKPDCNNLKDSCEMTDVNSKKSCLPIL
jgi:hypothetical protein